MVNQDFTGVKSFWVVQNNKPAIGGTNLRNAEKQILLQRLTFLPFILNCT